MKKTHSKRRRQKEGDSTLDSDDSWDPKVKTNKFCFKEKEEEKLSNAEPTEIQSKQKLTRSEVSRKRKNSGNVECTGLSKKELVGLEVYTPKVNPESLRSPNKSKHHLKDESLADKDEVQKEKKDYRGKKRIEWTPELHGKFVEAIDKIVSFPCLLNVKYWYLIIII